MLYKSVKECFDGSRSRHVLENRELGSSESVRKRVTGVEGLCTHIDHIAHGPSLSNRKSN